MTSSCNGPAKGPGTVTSEEIIEELRREVQALWESRDRLKKANAALRKQVANMAKELQIMDPMDPIRWN